MPGVPGNRGDSPGPEAPTGDRDLGVPGQERQGPGASRTRLPSSPAPLWGPEVAARAPRLQQGPLQTPAARAPRACAPPRPGPRLGPRTSALPSSAGAHPVRQTPGPRRARPRLRSGPRTREVTEVEQRRGGARGGRARGGGRAPLRRERGHVPAGHRRHLPPVSRRSGGRFHGSPAD